MNCAKQFGTVTITTYATSQCRYVDVWEQRGHDTLAIRPRTSSIVVPPLGDRQVAGALADIRAVQGAHPGRRTIYHIFRHVTAVVIRLVYGRLYAASNLCPSLSAYMVGCTCVNKFCGNDALLCWRAAMPASYFLAPCCGAWQLHP